ncbi:hypothetical protein CYLTODRAFT_413142 [Cylindrobasidium torrendii FP15055 ss-10]|uniref:Uncharacterized protein n=1 Tax=Cylindrobasidium torrendii FP15055 ss-10 TaxID=1314674 RepID=A0A0D7B283_9AGAR|nr:hypothetical protein CYLTODRAFT_413142 [Cylindrobasidium torrendii FP15055 ss-10]
MSCSLPVPLWSSRVTQCLAVCRGPRPNDGLAAQSQSSLFSPKGCLSLHPPTRPMSAHQVILLSPSPHVPSFGPLPTLPFTRGRLRAFARFFASLPAEVKREIIIWAINILWDALESANQGDVLQVRTVEAVYQFVGAFNKEYLDLFRRIVLRHVSFLDVPRAFAFLQSVSDTPGIALAVTTVELRGQGMGRHLEFVDIDVEEANITPLVKGLYHVGFRRCSLSLQHLSVALRSVTSLSAQFNDYAGGNTPLHGPLRLDALILHAKSAQESSLYSAILSRVEVTNLLCLRGITKGWQIHKSASRVKRVICLYGLPRSFDNLTVTGNLTLGVSDTCLQDILHVIPTDFDGRLMIVVDVTFGTMPEHFYPLWQVLHRCTRALTIRVAFLLRVRTPEQSAEEERLRIRPRLRTSNVNEDSTLCKRAIVEIHDRRRLPRYISE